MDNPQERNRAYCFFYLTAPIYLSGTQAKTRSNLVLSSETLCEETHILCYVFKIKSILA